MNQAAQQDQSPLDWKAYFASLVEDGSITIEQETDLLRFFRQLQSDGETRVAALSAEYSDRVSHDGKQDADTWLAQQATAMGREHREAIERLLESMGLPLPERGSGAHTEQSAQSAEPADEERAETGDRQQPSAPNIAIERPDEGPGRRRMRPRATRR